MHSLNLPTKIVLRIIAVLILLILFVYFALPRLAPMSAARYSPFLDTVIETMVRYENHHEEEMVMGAVLERIRGSAGPILLPKIIERYRVGDVGTKYKVVSNLRKISGDPMNEKVAEILISFFREVVNSYDERSSAEACLALSIIGDESSFYAVSKRGANYVDLQARKDWLRSLKFFKNSRALELLLIESNSSDGELREKAKEGIHYKYENS